MRERLGISASYNWAWVVSLPLLIVCSGDGTSVTTEPPPAAVVATIAVTPDSAALDVGGTQPFAVTVRDQSGNVMAGQPVEWSTSDPQTVTVNTSGMVTALAAGHATITAKSGGTTGKSGVRVAPPKVGSVTVSPPSASVLVGATTTLTAVVKDRQGNVMTGQAVAWSTNSAATATVNSDGVVTGVGSGAATISATASGQSGGSSITVTASPPPPPPPAPTPVVTTVTVSPPSASIAVGATVSLTAVVKDAQGNVMTGQTISWATSNAAVATVGANGVVTGVAGGSATITATSAGKSGTSAVTVNAPAPPPPAPTPVVTTVTVSPPSASIAVGATVSLTAVVKDAQGNVMTGQTITWATSDAAVATVSANGVVTGVAGGSATITATSAGKSGTSAVTVNAPAPPPPPPPSGGTLLFQENFEDANLASRGWYDNTNVLLNTTEHIAGSVRSSEYRYLAGSSTPTVGGAQRHKFTPTNSLYISYHVKYSANWVGSQVSYHPHELYVMSTLDGDWDGPASNFLTLYVEHNYQNGGIPLLAIQDNKSINYSYGSLPRNLIGVTENRSTSGCNGVSETNMVLDCYDGGGGAWYNAKKVTGPVVFQPSPGAGYKGNWNYVEVFFQLNTIVNGIGQKDGIMQYWFNGALVIDRRDIVFRTGARPTLKFSQFLIAPYIGVGSPVTQSMFIDNLRLATGRIP